MKKLVEIDPNASRELQEFSKEIQARFLALFRILEKEGLLKEPFAKRLSDNLFEIRVKLKGQWRALYAYIGRSRIIILSAFNKKTQRTPIRELEKAEKRLRRY